VLVVSVKSKLLNQYPLAVSLRLRSARGGAGGVQTGAAVGIFQCPGQVSKTPS